MKIFGLDKYTIIQLHVVLVLFGYYFISAVFNLVIGEISQSVSIGYRLFQFIVSLYVCFLCGKNIFRIQGNSLFAVCVFALIFFSFRFIVDIIGGPFVNIVSKDMFFRDFFFYVIGIFFSGFALFTSLKYLDIDKIVSISFWILLVTIICIMMNINNLNVNIAEERLDAGRGLSTLNVIRIGVFEVMVSMHLILNKGGIIKRIFYFIGLCFGIVVILISGSRGGLIALIFALFILLLFRNRKNIFTLILLLSTMFILYLNLVPVLEWLANYFPVISERLLLTVLEGDESEREVLRVLALQKIIDNPFCGYGYRLFPTEYVWSSHNGILDVLQISGIPMGILFLYFFYIKSSLLVFKISLNKRYFFPSVLLLYSLIYSLSGGLIYASTFWTAVALVCSSCYNKTK